MNIQQEIAELKTRLEQLENECKADGLMREAADAIAALQAQLAERDKEIADLKMPGKNSRAVVPLLEEITECNQVILEQQARIEELKYWLEEMQKCAAEENKGLLGADFALLDKDNLSALESALKAARLVGKIEGLEEAADNFEQWSTSYCGVEQERIFSSYSTELRRMANELKEQS